MIPNAGEGGELQGLSRYSFTQEPQPISSPLFYQKNFSVGSAGD
jgi:hypothetical protein